MIINFVGAFNQPGYVGEISDETHIARELEKLGATVRRIPRDAWREYVKEDFPEDKYDVPKELRADINLVAKWHHFYDGSFIEALKKKSEAPVFYWVWDYMDDGGFPDWHISMAQAADLYLSGEAGIFGKYKKQGINPYYFQMDVCDGDIPVFEKEEKKYDVIFTGSCIGQGHRKEWLQEINKEIPVKIWGWGHEEWEKLGFDASPPVYGEEYNKLIAQSSVVLGFSVEPNCWGYWSNRVGKVLRAGGFLLQEYAPGMESLIGNYSILYFSNPEEAIRIIKTNVEIQGVDNTKRWTSEDKAINLLILMGKYLTGKPEQWKYLS